MTIPEIRDRLHELADEYGIGELHDLANETKRHYHGRRARSTAPELTPELAAKIRAMADAYPHAGYMSIARSFRVSIGRVSEALFGKRQ